MCLNVYIFTYYRSEGENVIFDSLNLFFSQNYVKSLTSQESRKHAVSSVIDELRRTVWRPWCSRHYSLEMRKISISNFGAPKSCKLCTCNYSCAQMCVSLLIIAQYANICFSILWICVILWIVQKVSELRSH